jgi:multidrug efflux pump subunit AcrB
VYTSGFSPYNIENALKQSFSNNYCYQIKDGTHQDKVIVSAARENGQKIEDFDALYFHGAGKELVPFSSVATYRKTLGPLAINHTNNFPSVTIFFDLKDNYPIGQATKFLKQASKKIVPPVLWQTWKAKPKHSRSRCIAWSYCCLWQYLSCM